MNILTGTSCQGSETHWIAQLVHETDSLVSRYLFCRQRGSSGRDICSQYRSPSDWELVPCDCSNTETFLAMIFDRRPSESNLSGQQRHQLAKMILSWSHFDQPSSREENRYSIASRRSRHREIRRGNEWEREVQVRRSHLFEMSILNVLKEQI